MNKLISLILCSMILLCTAGCGNKQDKIEVAEQEVKVSLVTEDKAEKIEEKTDEVEETETKTEKDKEIEKSIDKKFVSTDSADKAKMKSSEDAPVRWVSTGYSFNVDGKIYYCYEVDYVPQCFSEYGIDYETPIENLMTKLKDVKTECISDIPEQVVMEDCGEYKRVEFGNYHDSLEIHIYPNKYAIFARDKSDINAEQFYAAMEKYFKINPTKFIEVKNAIEMLKNGEVDYVSADFKSDKSSGYFSYSLMPSEDSSSGEKQYSHKLSYHSGK